MICILDAESESDRSSSIHNLYLILARPNDLDEEEDNIVLNKGNKSLRNLIAAKGKEFTSKTTSKSQVAPPPPQIPIDLGLKPNSDLKKKWPVKTLEEDKVGSQKGTKQQKVVINARERRFEKSNIRLMCV